MLNVNTDRVVQRLENVLAGQYGVQMAFEPFGAPHQSFMSEGEVVTEWTISENYFNQ